MFGNLHQYDQLFHRYIEYVSRWHPDIRIGDWGLRPTTDLKDIYVGDMVSRRVQRPRLNHSIPMDMLKRLWDLRDHGTVSDGSQDRYIEVLMDLFDDRGHCDPTTGGVLPGPEAEHKISFML